ncbi:MAG: IS110 family transposase [Myxococcota bacterium]
MSTAVTRIGQDTKTLYVAFELGEKEWKLAMSTGLEARPRLRSLRARGTTRLLEILEKERQRLGAVRIVSCYEAGRDGFWLDRFLQAHGIESRIVDSASIEVRRRARRVKTDRLDAQKLLTMLHREALGEKDVWSVVHVPSVADEDARSLQREYRTLVKERSRSSNRIKGLLASQGLVAPRIDGRFLQWLERVRLWDGSELPPGIRRRVEREYARWQFTHDQVRALEKERRDRMKDGNDPGLEKVRALFALRGIGLGASWTYGLEFFSWRAFRNGKEVGALSGLAPTPHRSGELEHELGISRAGNRWVRGLAIEIAWGWLRHQPDSALSRWYQERFARGGPRARKVGIVALARKLLVALWRYVETGVVPEGARLKA